MRTIAIALMLVTSLTALTDSAAAQSQKVPYDAIIADDEVYARSGPGNKPYYPTSRLRKGDRVTVIRHDPGGWFMIEPPPGSFAWVRQEFVKREGDRGLIGADSQVVAWIGTAFGDDHYVEQRRLQPGEEVEILGEKTLRDERGEVAYFRIRSPQGHFRWIPGSKVVTSDKQLTAANARAAKSDPFAGNNPATNSVRDPNVAPVDMATLESNDNGATASDKQTVPPPKDISRRPAPTPKDLEAESPRSESVASSKSSTKTDATFASSSGGDGQQRLAAIDRRLQEMLQRNTRDWDFASIESELHELQQHHETSTGAVRRLAALDKYKRIKADYDDFARIMDETNLRDSEIAAGQRANPAPALNRPAPSSRPQTVPNSPNRSVPAGRSPAPAIPSRPSPNSPPMKGRFGGAGIIQRSGSNQPGVPKHVLVHPDGRRLAYLQGDGVDLDKYLGESMGLEGERAYRPDLKSDYMVVKSLQPVKLKP